jgi:hypothetical protein
MLWLLMASVGGLALTALKGARPVSREHWLLTIFALTCILHLQFSAVGWFYRYEAYLVILGIVCLPAAVRVAGIPSWGGFARLRFHYSNASAYLAVLIIFVLVLYPFAHRLGATLYKTPLATTNIYEQQYQMARFLNEYYANSVVVVNDIGAVSYKTNVEFVDLWGLGSLEVTRARRAGVTDPQFVLELTAARGAEIAVLLEHFDWFGGAPANWTRVGSWTVTSRNAVLADRTIVFYAVKHDEARLLEHNLREFSASLPPTVVQLVGQASRN